MYILGLHASGPISSAALIKDGQVVAAAPEERFNRQKMSRAFPLRALRYCLNAAQIDLAQVDYIATGWNPGINAALRYRAAFSDWTRHPGERLYTVPNRLLTLLESREVQDTLERFEFVGGAGALNIYHVMHHVAHAANAFFLSPFEEAAIFSSDFYGEKNTALWGVGRGNKIEVLQTIDFPHSLGAYYSAFTEFLGFEPEADEWKVMGAAAYGDPQAFYPAARKLVKLGPNGAFELELGYFNHYNFDREGLYGAKFIDLFGPPMPKDSPLGQREYDLAAAVQRVTEDVLFHCLEYLHERTRCPRLCLSGGTILNSVFNGKVLGQSKFKEVYIPFAPDDSGNSLGSALYLYYTLTDAPRVADRVHSFLGPEWSEEQVEATLVRYKIPYQGIDNIEAVAARLVAQGHIVGWFQGRMEFGQRALGNRSILADPRRSDMKDKINAAVKYREAFRPFAPSILWERTPDYFEMPDGVAVPFMEKVFPIKEHLRPVIPAVTHADGTGRLQTVSEKDNPRYYRLLLEFEKLTGVPVVLNTSFNIKGEPIACSPEDALRTFYTCGLDYLVMGRCLISKTPATLSQAELLEEPVSAARD